MTAVSNSIIMPFCVNFDRACTDFYPEIPEQIDGTVVPPVWPMRVPLALDREFLPDVGFPDVGRQPTPKILEP